MLKLASFTSYTSSAGAAATTAARRKLPRRAAQRNGRYACSRSLASASRLQRCRRGSATSRASAHPPPP
eukprot:6189133-Pleurochrysis_carterae.AAC.2